MTDVPADLMDEIVEYALGFCPEYPKSVDWENLLDRIEDVFDVDLGSDLMGHPIVDIRKAIRQARKEAAS